MDIPSGVSGMTDSVGSRIDQESGVPLGGGSKPVSVSGAGCTQPPVSIIQALRTRGLTDGTSKFEPLKGGRSNFLWRLSVNGQQLVVKLYSNRATDLFPNDPDAEMLALKHVLGAGLGPVPVAALQVGELSALIYEFIEGRRWRSDVTAVSALLAHLHAIPPPDGLRTIPAGGQAILDTGNRMLAECDGPDVRRLINLRPQPPEVPEVRRAFLHGDVVPDNLVDGPLGLRLIDWQCPACGDPAEDLAVFLSPAMQVLYGVAPLSGAGKRQFLDAFGDPALSERYNMLAAAFHWRMAAYCLWKSERGETDYAAGFRLECDLLETMTK